jgi:hypothetical protein
MNNFKTYSSFALISHQRIIMWKGWEVVKCPGEPKAILPMSNGTNSGKGESI